MKKRSNKKVKACAFGLNLNPEIFNKDMFGYAGETFGAVGGAVEEGTDDASAGAVAGSALRGLGKGASMGASLGSFAGPIGTAIGGAVGAVGGAIAGVFTGKKKQKAAINKRIRKESQLEAQMGLNNAAAAEQDYWEDNTQAYTFANGGVLPDLAYLDNNEVVRTNSGNIEQVPNTKPGTDNHLVDASNLDAVLSDKLKRPGTNKTFAQEGEKLVKMTKKSKGKDKFAEATDRLNKINANKMYDQLLAEQEVVKAKKGIKPKTKNLVPAYGSGKTTDYWSDNDVMMVDAEKLGEYADIDALFAEAERKGLPNYKKTGRITVRTKDYGVVQMDKSGNLYYSDGIAVSNDFGDHSKPAKQVKIKQTPKDTPQDLAELEDEMRKAGMSTYSMSPEQAQANYEAWMRNMLDAQAYYANLANAILPEAAARDAARAEQQAKARAHDQSRGATAFQILMKPFVNRQKNVGVDGITEETILLKDNNQLATIEVPEVKTPAVTPDIRAVNAEIQQKAADNVVSPRTIGSFDPSSLASLAPTLANFISGLKGPEVEDTVLNPYASSINRAMAKRRMNIEPTLRANRRARTIAANNMANMNANTGMNLAGRTQLAASEYDTNANIYANRDNANNAYLGEYANMMNNLGQQFVQSQVNTNNLNAANRASARNMMRTAASQIGQWAQVQQLMKNQARRDTQTLPYLKNFLDYGSPVAYSNQITV